MFKMENYKKKRPDMPNGMYSGRGIVIVGGNGRFQTPYWIAVHALRRAGCDLPIEVWFPEKELPSCDRKRALEDLGVSVRSFGEL